MSDIVLKLTSKYKDVLCFIPTKRYIDVGSKGLLCREHSLIFQVPVPVKVVTEYVGSIYKCNYILLKFSLQSQKHTANLRKHKLFVIESEIALISITEKS
jgi:hypothetical protein